MLKSILCLLIFAGSTQVDTFKKEMEPLQSGVNTAVTSTSATFTSSGQSKATYLEGYGVIVVSEVVLEPPVNIFGSPKTSDQVKTIVAQRYQQLKDRLSVLLKQQIVKTGSVGPTESMAFIVHLSNYTRADVPDLPKQLVIMVKKDAPDQIKLQEY